MKSISYINSSLQEDQLLLDIQSLKEQLIEMALLIGLNHPKTVFLSQKLDQLIVKYQKWNFPR
ncbi:aspartyl-phosphate phosphatase Spo0E family protein [Metabacillus fastidiosus]|uniref:aspartyl-phosphate phosphatase Spo0E family protein n=1 Tax=Metabacillus fastidiosus TaxID=1458 RepID=UPI002DBF56AE|nr:aspartyl-phosphate phosphatase Spo0E family protein [Metabacillus fastidiosus]MEC2078352.1 aspartyl-phosphate phosphatase Spo0E family protein [Metabacillus fastidiosus]